MQSPTIRLDLVDGNNGETIKRIPLDYGNATVFDNWPIDGEVRTTVVVPSGYPLEIRIRRIL